MNKLVENIKVLCHSAIKMEKEKIIYFDPYNVEQNYNDADIIFITHDHYDHYSEENIDKVKSANTVIVTPVDLEKKLQAQGWAEENIVLVEPNKSYTANEISFETVPAYNVGKAFHPKQNNWAGYIVELERSKVLCCRGHRHYRRKQKSKMRCCICTS